MSVTPDLDEVQTLARATCTELHTNALETGRLIRARRDPASYQSKTVFPVIYAALATGIVQVKG